MMSEATELFYVSIGTLIGGVVALVIRTLYKSKCTQVRCCGCIECDRDIEAENNNDSEVSSNNHSHQRPSRLEDGIVI